MFRMSQTPRSADLSLAIKSGPSGFPFKSELSLATLFEFWQKKYGDDTSAKGVFMRTVREQVRQVPELMGPIADRPVLSHTLPVYPEWAKREAVEGSVTLYFLVRTDGTVRENVLVQKTAGFGDFDDNARAALRAWRFEPLHDGRTGDQWGTITFHFRLREGD